MTKNDEIGIMKSKVDKINVLKGMDTGQNFVLSQVKSLCCLWLLLFKIEVGSHTEYTQRLLV